ncbi:ParB family chromosome partitioning protein [Methylosinus sp. sav-2]|uniref:ParB/RepB/Spo0J family partition protein n=1 Tax=Methylosinus sp. sav-2 TaxID=2485168 RepID=UPI00047D1F4F|nr:ParB N-terminal domain-containing protein [Methylosinus sp. sav-2]TDX64029.1 ParB family chromosome partitioning protein [Methylosinus sp. sav-2]
MSEIIDEELPLSLITRLSPLNPRQDMDSDVSTLAATIRARGLLHPILVHALAGEGLGEFAVLAGGRRWRALRSIDPDATSYLKVHIFKGSDAEAREAALAEAVTQKPLHPVEEFEAFADLEKAGFDVPTIARDFALTERHVKQRLALGRLSPRVRALWRDGKISRDLAEVFTGGTIEAQDAVLDGCNDAPQLYFVRKALRREGVGAHEALAKFILAEPARRASYELLGGRIEESLFSEETILLDRTIARNFADGYLLDAAEEIMRQEGWGRAEIEGGMLPGPDPLPFDSDYTAKELRRLETINKQLVGADAEDRAALEKEVEEIDLRAYLRAIPKKERAALGVRAELDSNGNVEIIRAVPQAEPEMELEEREEIAEPGAARKDAKAKTCEQSAPEPAAIPPALGGKDQEWIIRDAIGGGLARATARNPYLALALATAALGCSHGCVGIGLRTTFDDPPEPPRHDLLQRLAPSHFSTALAIVATTPLADLTVAFAEVVERAICFDDVKPAQLQNFVSLAQRMGAVRTDVAEALDHKALFQALSRDEALDAIRAIDGEAAAAEAGKLRKPKIVERAAILAKDRKWLPEAAATLFASGPEDTRSTAQAMVEAIEADEKGLDDDAAGQVFDARRAARETEESAAEIEANAAARNWAREVEIACIGERGLHIMSRFLIERCYPNEGAANYAVSDFRSDLQAFGQSINPDFHIDAHEQDAVLFDLGVTAKRKTKSGYVLLGLSWREIGDKARDAAE